MRARDIKPGFFKSDQLAECSPWARLAFAGLWMLADREGRLEDRPKRIKAEILPYDNEDMDSLLNELQENELIIRYQVNGKRYVWIPKFLEHQRPHPNEKASEIPPYQPEQEVVVPKIEPVTCQEEKQSEPREQALATKVQSTFNQGEKCFTPREQALRPSSLTPDILTPGSTPLYPPKGEPVADAPASVSAQVQEAKHEAQEQPAPSPQPEPTAVTPQPEQPTLSPEQPAKSKRKKGRKDRRDELPVRPQDFDRWYSLFPRKDAKQDAVCAWNDADEEGVLPEITVLEKALEWQIQANDWNPRTRRNYIPMPATYLNARRWRDEPPKFASQSFQQNTSYRPQYNTNNGGMDKFEAQRLCGQQYIEELVQQGFVTDSPSENKNNSIEAELVSPFQLPQAHM